MINYDYLLVNSTNEYLEEYTDLSENARYKLTGFSGSTGDAILSKNGNIFLFVDGRYHSQADMEVDKSKVKVIKLGVGETFIEKLFELLNRNSTLAIVSKKNSQYRIECFEKYAKIKNIELLMLDDDPILNDCSKPVKDCFQKINIGLSTQEKIKIITSKISDSDAIFTANQEEISYVLNKRDFSKNYSSAIKKQKLLITKHGVFDIDYKVEGNIFADKLTTSFYDFKNLNLIPLEINLIKEMKSIKTKDEIEHYKKCFERTDKAILETKIFIEENDNISEYDIAKSLEKNFYKYGAKSLSFKSIVAKDKNSALAHYSKNSKEEIIKEGSLILIDCGAYYEGGFATDCTRVFVKGVPSLLQIDVYTKVLKAFLNAISTKVLPETTGFDIDRIARKFLNEIKPEGFEFSHSLGHGIGISVHENPPTLCPSDIGKIVLKPNMCFTIEPGLYNPECFGVRLENSCFLDDEYKINSFSNLCFEKKLIDFSLLNKNETEVLSRWI